MPSHLRGLHGNPSHSKRNQQEPKPPRGIPECPDHLSEYAREVWPDLCGWLDGMGVLALSDALALSMLAEAYADWRECMELVAEEGRTVERTNKLGHASTFAHPAVAQLSDAWRRTLSMMCEFGLTPAARTKVKAEKREETDPLDDILAG